MTALGLIHTPGAGRLRETIIKSTETSSGMNKSSNKFKISDIYRLRKFCSSLSLSLSRTAFLFLHSKATDVCMSTHLSNWYLHPLNIRLLRLDCRISDAYLHRDRLHVTVKRQVLGLQQPPQTTKTLSKKSNVYTRQLSSADRIGIPWSNNKTIISSSSPTY